MKGRNEDEVTLVDPRQLEPWLGGRSFENCYAEYKEEGYIVFRNVMSPEEGSRVRDALKSHFVHRGRNNFEGFKSNRVYALLAKSPRAFSDMVSHPSPWAFPTLLPPHRLLP